MASPYAGAAVSNIPVPTFRSAGNKVIVPIGSPANHCLLVPASDAIISRGYNMRAGSSSGKNNNNDNGPWSAGAFKKGLMRGGSLSSSSNGMDSNAGARQTPERPYTMLSKLGAEFIGTMLLVFIGSLSGLNTSPKSNALLHAAFAHGLTIFVAVASLGHISGGHFNPAVSLAVVLAGKMQALSAVSYWIAQLAGGFSGALLVRFVTDQRQYDSIGGGATIVPGEQLWYQAAVIEMILTAILAQTVLTCAVDTNANMLAPLAIGMTVALDIFAGGPLSGASMNPARSFGPCLVASYFLQNGPGTKLTDPIWAMHFVYWAGPLLGAALASFIYRSLMTRSNNRICP